MSQEFLDAKVPAHQVYQQIYTTIKLNPRTVQWYATEGYIPKPEKIGSEAFYAPAAQIPARVRVIHTLRKRFDLKLKQIREIVERQANSDWEEIQNLFSALEDMFPYLEIDDFGNEFVTRRGSTIARYIIHQLATVPVDQISLADAEDEYEQTSQQDPEQSWEIPF
jgi:DNA-binding transcriptional MerR regulator